MTDLDRCYNIFDLREVAKRRLPKGIFEYVDKGTEDGISLEENRAAFHRLKLHTHFLNDCVQTRPWHRDLRQAHQPAVRDRAHGQCGTDVVSGRSGTGKGRGGGGHSFYVSHGCADLIGRGHQGRARCTQMVSALSVGRTRRATTKWSRGRADLGWEALVVTIDHAPGRGREHNERNGFSFPFKPNMTAAVDMAKHPGWLLRVMGKYLMNDGLPTNANYPDRYRFTVIDGKTSQESAAIPGHDLGTYPEIPRVLATASSSLKAY